LYQEQAGLDVDSEDEEEQVAEQEYEYKDGMKWLVSRGSPPSLSSLAVLFCAPRQQWV